jgi:putative ABC transport system permease protein
MTQALLRAALFFAPREFRTEYSSQICEDYAELAGDGQARLRMAANVAASGLGLRIESAWRNLRNAVRSLARTPVFTLVCVATLALAISVNTTVFSVVDTVLLHPLPFADSARLTFLGSDAVVGGGTIPGAQIPAYQSENQTFAGIASYEYGEPTLTGARVAQTIKTERVSWNLFDVAQATPQLGRFFRATDERGAPAIVLSDATWRRLFDGRTDALGRGVRIDGVTYRVVGIAKSEFVMPDERATLAFTNTIAAWLCAPASDFSNGRLAHRVYALGRLKPGVTAAAGQADLARTAARMAKDNPAQYRDVGIAVVSLESVYLGGTRTMLILTFIAVALILLIACANVANLLLVRAAARRQEAGLRSALGALRQMLVAQFLGEVAVLAVAGGALGAFLAAAQIRLIQAFGPLDIPRLTQVHFDARVAVCVLLVIGVCMIVAGLVPAIAAGRRQLTTVLSAGGRSGGAIAGTARARSVLVAVQVALAFVVLATSSLLIRSWFVLEHRSVGYSVDGAYAGYMILGNRRYADPRATLSFVNRAVERVAALPRVADVAAAYNVPCTRGAAGGTQFHVVGKPLSPNPVTASFNSVTPQYFQTMRIPLLRGRAFDSRDRSGSGPVMIISDVLARYAFGDADPIGKQMAFDPANPTLPARTIVGVVGSVRNRLDGRLQGTIYVPFAQYPIAVFQLVIRSNEDPATLGRAVTAAIAPIDTTQAPPTLISLRSSVESWSVSQRTNAVSFAVLATVALALAFAGIYGVVAQSAAQRTQEFGIRMALGASRRRILMSVTTDALGIGIVGAAVGTILSVVAVRGAESLLFGISPFDPLALGVAAVLLVGCAVISAAIPAGRATLLSPVTALRYE